MPINEHGKPCGRGSAGVKVGGRRFALFKDEEPDWPDTLIDALFRQALVGSYKGEPYIDVLRRYTRLVAAQIGTAPKGRPL